MKKIPRELNKIVDKVLAYKPKPKSKVAKRRAEQVAMQHEVRQEERLCADLGFKPCLCEILRPIFRRANLRVFETPPVSGSEYWRLAALPDEMRTLEEDWQMVDYLLVHLRDDLPFPPLPDSARSQELEGLAAWRILLEQHALWLSIGAVLRDNPNVFERAFLEQPAQRPEFLLESPLAELNTTRVLSI